MCRCFFVPLLLQQKISFSVALLCCSVSFSLQKPPFEILIAFIFFIFPFGLYLQSLDGKGQLLSEGSFETGWSPLPFPLASPELRQRRPEAVLRSSELPRTGDGLSYFHVLPHGVWWLSCLICFSHFQNLWSSRLWWAGILLHVGSGLGIPAGSGTHVLMCVCLHEESVQALEAVECPGSKLFLLCSGFRFCGDGADLTLAHLWPSQPRLPQTTRVNAVEESWRTQGVKPCLWICFHSENRFY